MSRYRSPDNLVHTLSYKRGRQAGRFIHARYSLEYPESLTAEVTVYYSTHPRPLWLVLGNTRPPPGDREAARGQLEADLAGVKSFLPRVFKGGLRQLLSQKDTAGEVSATYYLQKQVRNPAIRLERWIQLSEEILADASVRRQRR